MSNFDCQFGSFSEIFAYLTGDVGVSPLVAAEMLAQVLADDHKIGTWTILGLVIRFEGTGIKGQYLLAFI